MILNLMLTLALLLPGTAAALPDAAWYAVVYDFEGDTLLWINDDGLVATLPRPHLEGEAENPNLQLRISPDGRYLLIAADLAAGTQGLGFYDLGNGQFLQTHQTQPSEQVFLGGRHAFDINGEVVAVGFATLSESTGAAGWRVIVFDVTSGDALRQLSHDDESAQPHIADLTLGGYYPNVVYVDEASTAHTQFIVFGDPVSPVPAIAWDFAANTVNADQTYHHAFQDILPTTGDVLYPFHDDSLGSVGEGYFGDYNAIGTGEAAIFTTDSQSLLFPAWAAGGDAVIFRGFDAEQNATTYWYRDGNAQALPFPETVDRVLGTDDGFVAVAASGTVFALQGEQIVSVYQPNGYVQLVWAPPIGSSFALETVAGANVVAE